MSVLFAQNSTVELVKNSKIVSLYRAYQNVTSGNNFYTLLGCFNSFEHSSPAIIAQLTPIEISSMLTLTTYALIRFLSYHNGSIAINAPLRIKTMWLDYLGALQKHNVEVTWPQILFYSNFEYLLDEHGHMNMQEYGFRPVLVIEGSTEELIFMKKIILIEFLAHVAQQDGTQTTVNALLMSISRTDFTRFYKEHINMLIGKLHAGSQELKNSFRALPFRFISTTLNEHFADILDNDFIYT